MTEIEIVPPAEELEKEGWRPQPPDYDPGEFGIKPPRLPVIPLPGTGGVTKWPPQTSWPEPGETGIPDPVLP